MPRQLWITHPESILWLGFMRVVTVLRRMDLNWLRPDICNLNFEFTNSCDLTSVFWNLNLQIAETYHPFCLIKWRGTISFPWDNIVYTVAELPLQLSLSTWQDDISRSRERGWGKQYRGFFFIFHKNYRPNLKYKNHLKYHKNNKKIFNCMKKLLK
jgi:hypothetical protein